MLENTFQYNQILEFLSIKALIKFLRFPKIP